MLGYVLRSRDFSSLAQQYNLFRILNFNRTLGMPNWPVLPTRITEVKWVVLKPNSTPITVTYRGSDLLFVTFEYEVIGIKYTNQFKVLCSPQDRFWERVAAERAVDESVMVRYDPQNPTDAVPAEQPGISSGCGRLHKPPVAVWLKYLGQI